MPAYPINQLEVHTKQENMENSGNTYTDAFGNVFSMMSDKMPVADSEYTYKHGKHDRLRVLQPEKALTKEEVIQDVPVADRNENAQAMMFTSVRDKTVHMVAKQTSHQGLTLEDVNIEDRTVNPLLARNLQDYSRKLQVPTKALTAELNRTNVPSSHVEDDVSSTKRFAHYQISDDLSKNTRKAVAQDFGFFTQHLPSLQRPRAHAPERAQRMNRFPTADELVHQAVRYQPGLYNLRTYAHQVNHHVATTYGAPSANPNFALTSRESFAQARGQVRNSYRGAAAPTFVTNAHEDVAQARGQVRTSRRGAAAPTFVTNAHEDVAQARGQVRTSRRGAAAPTFVTNAHEDVADVRGQVSALGTSIGVKGSTMTLGEEKAATFRSQVNGNDMEDVVKQYMKARDVSVKETTKPVVPQRALTKDEEFQQSVKQIFANNTKNAFEFEARTQETVEPSAQVRSQRENEKEEDVKMPTRTDMQVENGSMPRGTFEETKNVTMELDTSGQNALIMNENKEPDVNVRDTKKTEHVNTRTENKDFIIDNSRVMHVRNLKEKPSSGISEVLATKQMDTSLKERMKVMNRSLGEFNEKKLNLSPRKHMIVNSSNTTEKILPEMTNKTSFVQV
jgi:hypothetical protein